MPVGMGRISRGAGAGADAGCHWHWFRRRPIGEAGSFADKLHPAANAEFRKQRRDVELHRAFGKIKIPSNFLVGEPAENAAENFFFAAGNFDFALDGLSCLKQLLSLFKETVSETAFDFGHDHIVFWSLSAHHAMHGKKARGLFKGQVAV